MYVLFTWFKSDLLWDLMLFLCWRVFYQHLKVLCRCVDVSFRILLCHYRSENDVLLDLFGVVDRVLLSLSYCLCGCNGTWMLCCTIHFSRRWIGNDLLLNCFLNLHSKQMAVHSLFDILCKKIGCLFFSKIDWMGK